MICSSRSAVSTGLVSADSSSSGSSSLSRDSSISFSTISSASDCAGVSFLKSFSQLNRPVGTVIGIGAICLRIERFGGSGAASSRILFAVSAAFSFSDCSKAAASRRIALACAMAVRRSSSGSSGGSSAEESSSGTSASSGSGCMISSGRSVFGMAKPPFSEITHVQAFFSARNVSSLRYSSSGISGKRDASCMIISIYCRSPVQASRYSTVSVHSSS